jgi:hypothetical protein
MRAVAGRGIKRTPNGAELQLRHDAGFLLRFIPSQGLKPLRRKRGRTSGLSELKLRPPG